MTGIKFLKNAKNLQKKTPLESILKQQKNKPWDNIFTPIYNICCNNGY